MPSTDAAQKPALRDRPLGKALALLAVLLVAFVAAQSCASSEGEISKDEAIEIARDQVTWGPEGVQVRNVGQGIPARRVWAVSLYDGTPTDPGRTTVVEIDSETGEVIEITGPRS